MLPLHKLFWVTVIDGGATALRLPVSRVKVPQLRLWTAAVDCSHIALGNGDRLVHNNLMHAAEATPPIDLRWVDMSQAMHKSRVGHRRTTASGSPRHGSVAATVLCLALNTARHCVAGVCVGRYAAGVQNLE